MEVPNNISTLSANEENKDTNTMRDDTLSSMSIKKPQATGYTVATKQLMISVARYLRYRVDPKGI